MTVGEKIKTARLKKGLSQRKMAELLGVSQPAYLEWEHGDSVPNWARMKSISCLISVSLDELAFDKETMNIKEETKKTVSWLYKLADMQGVTTDYLLLGEE